MKDGQEQIYYMTGESRSSCSKAPRTWRPSRRRASRCCCSPTRSTRCGSGSVPEFDGKPFQSIAKGEVDLDTEEEKKAHEAEREEQEKDFADLLDLADGDPD